MCTQTHGEDIPHWFGFSDEQCPGFYDWMKEFHEDDFDDMCVKWQLEGFVFVYEFHALDILVRAHHLFTEIPK